MLRKGLSEQRASHMGSWENITGRGNKTQALRQEYAGHVQEIVGKFVWLDRSKRKGECRRERWLITQEVARSYPANTKERPKEEVTISCSSH